MSEPVVLCDIHCHGGDGAHFGTDPSANRAAMGFHRRAGTDQLVASLVSASDADLSAAVSALAPLVRSGDLVGIHVEGPFLSQHRRGAHNPAVLRQPDTGLVERLVAIAADAGHPGALVQWTFAPELEGSRELIAVLVEAGIVPAVGHTDADASTCADALAAIAEAQNGPALVTHLFNGMAPMHHRAPSAAGAALAAAARGEAIVELIADGVHLAPETVRMVFDCVGPDHVVLVSDAMCAAGRGDGNYQLGSVPIEVANGVARTADGAIAGSTTTLAEAVEWTTAVAGVAPSDALRAASVTARRALGLAER